MGHSGHLRMLLASWSQLPHFYPEQAQILSLASPMLGKEDITFFCKRYSVILQEDDFQLAADDGVIVHYFCHGGDQLYDHFGHVISRGSLGEEQQYVETRSDG